MVSEIDGLERISSFEALKAVSVPLRQSILECLMEKPATLSQLGRIHHLHPARIRYHLKLLEESGLVSLHSTKIAGGFVEKYYQASSRAYLINRLLLPNSPLENTLLFMGSHDMALALLVEGLRHVPEPVDLRVIFVGSLDGVIALRQGACQVAGSHLKDPDDGQFNLSIVRALFPGRKMLVVTFAEREQGLILKSGNPLGLAGVADAAREEVHLINRQAGSGTRIWLDRYLESSSIDARRLSGYEKEVNSHLQVAQAVAAGEADVGLGLLAAARRFELGFLPLFQERYDLILPAAAAENRDVQKMLDLLNSAALQRRIGTLDGYDTKHTGEVQTLHA